ncbi:MAG: F0F1 ATP synthase subunit B' [Proteobacteria bacterium]|nr:F0F1 ATP synthase subunit B' [Pseudomonadota bacterium]
MPQFDPSTFSSQIFWLVVTFALLYWVVAKIAVPRIGEVLDQRARVIQEDLDRALALKGETDQAVQAYEKAMAAARDQAGDHMRAVTSEAKATADARTAELSAVVGKQVAEAEARIAKAKEDALASLRGIAADTAKDVVAKLAGLSPSQADLDAAVTAALKETK